MKVLTTNRLDRHQKYTRYILWFPTMAKSMKKIQPPQYKLFYNTLQNSKNLDVSNFGHILSVLPAARGYHLMRTLQSYFSTLS